MNLKKLAAMCACGLMAAATAMAEAPKVGGLTAGMSPQQVNDALTKRGLTNVTPNVQATTVYTLRNGQQRELPNSKYIPSANFNSGFTSKSDGESIQVWFTPFPGQEKGVKIQRDAALGISGTHPSADGIVKQLEETYGKPTHSYRDGPARASLTWRWDAKGLLHPPKQVVQPCEGTRGASSAKDDPQGQCGALALTVRLMEGVGPKGPGVSHIQSILVDYAEIRRSEVEMNRLILEDQKKTSTTPQPRTNVKL